MSIVALVLYLVGLGAAFGVRTWLHVRRTGTSGFHGISGRPGSLRWCAGVLFVLALVLGAAALTLAVSGLVPARAGTDGRALVGLVLAVAGTVGVLAAQTGMGTSWRIGVEETERTDLVTDGPFAMVRNPIFTAMIVVQAGLSLMVPTWLSLTALACLVVAVEMQVRLIEEPYLLEAHGPAYRSYAAATGRFVPGVGRLASPAAQRPSTTG
jgi:protein-S-isoprenylcysteine O-methyltransferase Ste14